MNTIKVSVILTVYNPGEGIRKCVEILRNQPLKEIEMIFVDDCGTDGAMDLVKEAARQDDRIRYIVNPENMGTGISRNRAIEIAKGEYLAFVDPDDYISEDFLELLYKKGKETGADIVKGDRILVGLSGEKIVEAVPDNQNERIRKGLQQGTNLCLLFTYNHWTAIYRREYVMACGARYGTTRNSQDTTFQLRVCFGTRKIAFEEGAIYCYVARENSRIRDFSQRRLEAELLAVKEKADFLEGAHADEETAARYMRGQIPILLMLEASMALMPGKKELAEDFLNSLRTFIQGLPYCSRISSCDILRNAFLEYGANLSVVPYREQWGETSFDEYLDVIRRQSVFIGEHPELGGKCRENLRKAFRQAINYNSKEEDPEVRRQGRQMILQEFLQLPDVTLLTKNDVMMILDPSGDERGTEQFRDCMDRVDRVVSFISAHPEKGREYRELLWNSFERAITYRPAGEEKICGRKEARRLLVEQADRLPDRKLLTDDFLAMDLYVNHAVDVFALRTTAFGKGSRALLKKIRRLRSR